MSKRAFHKHLIDYHECEQTSIESFESTEGDSLYEWHIEHHRWYPKDNKTFHEHQGIIK